MSIKLDSCVDGIIIEIDEVPTDSTNWKTIQDQSYRPDKQQFMLDKFRNDFPNQSISNYEMLANIASQNDMLGDWYSKTNLLYRKDIEVPRYLTKAISPEEYAKLEDNIVKYSEKNSLESMEIQKEASKYDAKIAEIRAKYNKERKELRTNSTIKILTLSVKELPLTCTIAISNFTPGAEESAPTSKAYAREVLINYQLGLLKIIKENPDIDIDKIIQGLRTK